MARTPQASVRAQRHRKVRALAVVVCVLASLSLIADAAHLTLVAHAVCPDHGELIHVDDAAADADAARPSPADAPAVSGDHSGDHSHDHCSAVAHGEAATLPSRVVQPEIVTTVELALAGAPAASFSRKQLLLLAPKTSPPL